MNSNQTSSSLWPCYHSVSTDSWNISCTICRLGGVIILLISIVCFIFNIRFLTIQRHQNSLVISLFIASLIVITVGVPYVVTQLFTCQRLCSKIYCRIEGFTSYLSGSLCMLIFSILSIHRYLSLHSYQGFLSYKYSTIICWFVSLLFTFPLVFDYLNSYIPEGLGFHCSINWQDQSVVSRIYLLFSFIILYLLPFIILFWVNFQAHFILRNIYTKNSLLVRYSYSSSSNEHNRPIQYCEQTYDIPFYIRKATIRKRFRIDYRFLRAIICLVGSYLLAWTPYSIVAVAQLLQKQFILQHTGLVTISAFLAKLSVIITPLVYLSVMNNRLFKKLFFK